MLSVTGTDMGLPLSKVNDAGRPIILYFVSLVQQADVRETLWLRMPRTMDSIA